MNDEKRKAVRNDTLAEDETLFVLGEALKLPTGIRLPEAARARVDLCGGVVVDLAYVGRWGTV